MERRDRSLKALLELRYIDSLDSDMRASSLQSWVESYLQNGNKIEDFDLDIQDLNSLSELFYKNIIFLKEHRESMKQTLDTQKKIREFLY
ncbi:MAG: hypothetical protein CSA86_01265 [Arcobacter sp.]|nr:MAG: hypothetical protein CSA86_01265 [Arcobacter sp.]